MDVEQLKSWIYKFRFALGALLLVIVGLMSPLPALWIGTKLGSNLHAQLSGVHGTLLTGFSIDRVSFGDDSGRLTLKDSKFHLQQLVGFLKGQGLQIPRLEIGAVSLEGSWADPHKSASALFVANFGSSIEAAAISDRYARALQGIRAEIGELSIGRVNFSNKDVALTIDEIKASALNFQEGTFEVRGLTFKSSEGVLSQASFKMQNLVIQEFTTPALGSLKIHQLTSSHEPFPFVLEVSRQAQQIDLIKVAFYESDQQRADKKPFFSIEGANFSHPTALSAWRVPKKLSYELSAMSFPQIFGSQVPAMIANLHGKDLELAQELILKSSGTLKFGDSEFLFGSEAQPSEEGKASFENREFQIRWLVGGLTALATGKEAKFLHLTSAPTTNSGRETLSLAYFHKPSTALSPEQTNLLDSLDDFVDVEINQASLKVVADLEISIKRVPFVRDLTQAPFKREGNGPLSLSQVPAGSFLQELGLQSGDRFLGINGKNFGPESTGFLPQIAKANHMDLNFERVGKAFKIAVTIEDAEEAKVAHKSLRLSSSKSKKGKAKGRTARR